MTWKVFYYQTESGRYPVKEFMFEQDKKTHTRIRHSITLLSQKGPFLKPPYMKKLQRDLYELRIKGQIAIRIFYSPKKDAYFLLHAFKKKTQKTPSRELKTAIDRMKEII